MRLFKKKLAGYVADNPNLRWAGYYKVKYKGKWTTAIWQRYESDAKNNWYWMLADNTIFYGDDDFDDIIESKLKTEK